MAKFKTERITKRRVELTRLAVARYMKVLISPDIARRVLEADRELCPELTAGGHMDTLAREYLAQALIDVLMPGPPAAYDSLVGKLISHWHWPANGSDPAYSRAFWRAFRKAAARQGITQSPEVKQ